MTTPASHAEAPAAPDTLPFVLARMRIRPLRGHEWSAVLALWDRCGIERRRHETARDVARKRRVPPEQFLVAVTDDREIAASVLAWRERETASGRIDYLAVDALHRRRGLGRVMVMEAQLALRSIGCDESVVQLRREDLGAIAFWVHMGYVEHEPLRFTKILPPLDARA